MDDSYSSTIEKDDTAEKLGNDLLKHLSSNYYHDSATHKVNANDGVSDSVASGIMDLKRSPHPI